jgi:hypothetical protein
MSGFFKNTSVQNLKAPKIRKTVSISVDFVHEGKVSEQLTDLCDYNLLGYILISL